MFCEYYRFVSIFYWVVCPVIIILKAIIFCVSNLKGTQLLQTSLKLIINFNQPIFLTMVKKHAVLTQRFTLIAVLIKKLYAVYVHFLQRPVEYRDSFHISKMYDLPARWPFIRHKSIVRISHENSTIRAQMSKSNMIAVNLSLWHGFHAIHGCSGFLSMLFFTILS